MAILFAYGGDSEVATSNASESPEGNNFVWSNGGGAATIVKHSTVRSGVTAAGRSSQLNTGASSQSAISQGAFVGVAGRDYWVYAWFRIPSGNLPSGETLLYRQRTAASNNGIQVSINAAGTLRVYHNGGSGEFSGTLLGVSSVGLISVDTWYKFVLRFTRPGAGGNDTLILYIDDVAILSTTSADVLSISDPSMNFGWVSNTANANKTMYVDDYVILDNQGATFNSYPGDLHVNWLKPTADSARTGTVLWVGGAGGTTNLWDAVNNDPPVGRDTTADTNTSQIRHNGSGAGVYDATAAAYSTIGITATTQVASLMVAASTAEEVTTGDKLVRLGIASGPVVADTADQNVAAGSAAGTHPSGWKYLYGTRSASQPASIATTPVLRINRAETASRAVACEALWLQVTWERPQDAANYSVALANIAGAGLVPSFGLQPPKGAVSGAGIVPSFLALQPPKGAVSGAGLAPTPQANAVVPKGAISGTGITPATGLTLPVGATLAAAIAPTLALQPPSGAVAGAGLAPLVALAAPTGQASGAGLAIALVSLLLPSGAVSGAGIAPVWLATVLIPVGAITGLGYDVSIPALDAGGTFSVPLADIDVAGIAPTPRVDVPVPLATVAALGYATIIDLLLPVGAISGQGYEVTFDANPTITYVVPLATIAVAGLAVTPLAQVIIPLADTVLDALAVSPIVLIPVPTADTVVVGLVRASPPSIVLFGRLRGVLTGRGLSGDLHSRGVPILTGRQESATMLTGRPHTTPE